MASSFRKWCLDPVANLAAEALESAVPQEFFNVRLETTPKAPKRPLYAWTSVLWVASVAGFAALMGFGYGKTTTVIEITATLMGPETNYKCSMLSAYTVTKTMGSYDRCGASTNEPATFDAVFDSVSATYDQCMAMMTADKALSIDNFWCRCQRQDSASASQFFTDCATCNQLLSNSTLCFTSASTYPCLSDIRLGLPETPIYYNLSSYGGGGTISFQTTIPGMSGVGGIQSPYTPSCSLYSDTTFVADAIGYIQARLSYDKICGYLNSMPPYICKTEVRDSFWNILSTAFANSQLLFQGLGMLVGSVMMRTYSQQAQQQQQQQLGAGVAPQFTDATTLA